MHIFLKYHVGKGLKCQIFKYHLSRIHMEMIKMKKRKSCIGKCLAHTKLISRKWLAMIKQVLTRAWKCDFPPF